MEYSDAKIHNKLFKISISPLIPIFHHFSNLFHCLATYSRSDMPHCQSAIIGISLKMLVYITVLGLTWLVIVSPATEQCCNVS